MFSFAKGRTACVSVVDVGVTPRTLIFSDFDMNLVRLSTKPYTTQLWPYSLQPSSVHILLRDCAMARRVIQSPNDGYLKHLLCLSILSWIFVMKMNGYPSEQYRI